MPAKKTKKPSPSKSSSEYKYVPPSTSPFYQHVISPLCDRLCELLVPPTLHPDWLTFLGLLCALSSAGLFALGAHAGCAVLWIVYGLLDNMDGKQARRSRQSSPGGEFFDHTCDAFMTTLAAVLMRESLAPSLRTSLGPGIALGFVASVQGVYILGTWAHALLGRVLLGTCVQSTDWLTVDEMNFFVIPIFVLARGYMPVLPDFRPPLPLGTFSSWLFSLPLPPSLQSLWFSFLSGGGEGGQLPGDAWVRFLSLGTCMVLFMIGFTIVGTANLLFLIFQWSALLQFLVIPSFVSTVLVCELEALDTFGLYGLIVMSMICLRMGVIDLKYEPIIFIPVGCLLCLSIFCPPGGTLRWWLGASLGVGSVGASLLLKGWINNQQRQSQTQKASSATKRTD